MGYRTVRLSLTPDDLAIDPRILADIGRIIIRWAAYETLVDTEIRDLQTQREGGSFHDQTPVSFTRRIDAWKRLTRELYPKRQDYHKAVSLLTGGGLKLSQARNVLIHGLWHGLDPEQPGRFKMGTFKHSNGELAYIEHSIHPEKLGEMAIRISQLHRQTARYCTARKQGNPIRVRPPSSE